jgi:ABC-type antimicrobial peptide transport system permease subunit
VTAFHGLGSSGELRFGQRFKHALRLRSPIRMALGAQRRELMRLVVRHRLLLALAGAAIGIGAAMAVTWLMAAILYSVRPYDPATFAGVCILLVRVAQASCSIPARRAMRMDPMVALRYE